MQIDDLFVPWRNCGRDKASLTTLSCRFNTIWQSNMAMEIMEDILFISDFPIESPISSGFPIATFDYQRVPDIAASPWHGRSCHSKDQFVDQKYDQSHTSSATCIVANSRLWHQVQRLQRKHISNMRIIYIHVESCGYVVQVAAPLKAAYFRSWYLQMAQTIIVL